MELKQLLRVLRRRWLVASLVMLLVVGAGTAAALLPASRYTAEVTLVAQPDPDAVTFGQVQLVEFLMPSLNRQVEGEDMRRQVEASLPPVLRAVDHVVTSSLERGSGVFTIAVESTEARATAPIANAYASALLDEPATEDLLELSVLDSASVPTSPSAPPRQLIVMGSVVLGVIAAVFAALVANAVRGRYEGADAIRKQFGTTILGELPRRRRRSAKLDIATLMTDTSSPAVSEAFQRVRTNVELAMVGERTTSLAVTSVGVGEGKSTVAAALGWAMASAGHRVTLIDGDLRRPSLHERLGLPAGPGLAALTRHDARVDLRPTPLPSLRLVPAGVPDRHPTEVISMALPRVLDTAERSSIAIVDCPPLEGIAETSLIAALTSAVILVVDARSYDEAALERAIYRLHEAGAKVLGVVINRVRQPRTSKRMSAYYYAPPTPQRVDDAATRSRQR